MRLIDADKLMKKIREVDFVADAEQMKITHDSMMTGFFHGRVQGIVDYLPTAYDIDEVVEQLEEIEVSRNEYSEIMECNIEPCTYTSCYECIRDKAIEIVKGGAV